MLCTPRLLPNFHTNRFHDPQGRLLHLGDISAWARGIDRFANVWTRVVARMGARSATAALIDAVKTHSSR